MTAWYFGVRRLKRCRERGSDECLNRRPLLGTDRVAFPRTAATVLWFPVGPGPQRRRVCARG